MEFARQGRASRRRASCAWFETAPRATRRPSSSATGRRSACCSTERVAGLDSGCVWGGRSARCGLRTATLYQVPCARLPSAGRRGMSDCVFCKIVARQIPATRGVRGRAHARLHGPRPRQSGPCAGRGEGARREPLRARRGAGARGAAAAARIARAIRRSLRARRAYRSTRRTARRPARRCSITTCTSCRATRATAWRSPGR